MTKQIKTTDKAKKMNYKTKLQAIRLQNYRVFQDTGWIEFSPFTILYGKNSNGKSTILKFLYFMQKSLAYLQQDTYKDLFQGDRDEDGSFRDFLYKGLDGKQEIIFSFRIRLSDDDCKYILDGLQEFAGIDVDYEAMSEDKLLEVTYAYSYNVETKAAFVSNIEFLYSDLCLYGMHYSGDEWSVNTALQHFDWHSDCPLPVSFDIRNTFALIHRENPIFRKDIDPDTVGDELLPAQRFVSAYLYTIKSMINNAIKDFASHLDYIGPQRDAASRTMVLTASNEKRAGIRGENIFNLLFEFEIGNKADRTDEINKWLEKFGYRYKWNILKPNYGEFLLEDIRTGYQINIMDVGFGISQVLPIIVSAVSDSDGVLAIDAPEAHLHDQRHGDIADLLLQASSHRPVMIESHSESILLRVQRRIAENSLSPEHVTIYYIHNEEQQTVCDRISLDKYGNFVGDVKDFKLFFSSEYDEVLKISNAQLDRRKKEHENRH